MVVAENATNRAVYVRLAHAFFQKQKRSGCVEVNDVEKITKIFDSMSIFGYLERLTNLEISKSRLPYPAKRYE